MLKYKHIEASREVRLWLGQIIIPAVLVGTIILNNNPRLRYSISRKIRKTKNSIANRIQKIKWKIENKKRTRRLMKWQAEKRAL